MNDKHQKYVEGLASEEKMLITLRNELYGGQWERMLKDLNDRLKGRPYIFKLINRIKSDIKRIEKLQEYEKKNNINLADYL
ncbi:MAG: hypothetical protein WC980_09760 [Candidatus Brocadiia bacterium]